MGGLVEVGEGIVRRAKREAKGIRKESRKIDKDGDVGAQEEMHMR